MSLSIIKRILFLFLFGVAILSPKVLLAAEEDAAKPAAEKVVLSKEARAALASFRGENLIKNLEKMPPGPTKKEIDMGKKSIEQLDKQIEKAPDMKMLDPEASEENQALYDKLNKIADNLGKHSGRPDVKYTVKIIESDQINAFTLPNGSIYFFTGLLDTLHSDDEIAAVMGHEISHNVMMHVMRGESKSRKISLMNLAVLLAALGSGSREASNAVMFSQYLSVGLMNEYSEEYESEADIVGSANMMMAGYNPSAMATVMQRFAVEDKRRPDIQAGIFQDHPESTTRVENIKRAIEAAGLKFNPRQVSGDSGAKMETDDKSTFVKFRNSVLMEFPNNDDATKTRAEHAAQLINDLLKENLQLYEIKVTPQGENIAINARNFTIVTVTPQDVTSAEMTTEQLANQWRSNISQLFWREALNGGL